MILFNKIFRQILKNNKVKVIILKENELKAVHDSDLGNFLKSIGEYEKVETGQAKCYFCGKVMSFDNIFSILPVNSNIGYCCNDNKCYKLLLEKGETENASS